MLVRRKYVGSNRRKYVGPKKKNSGALPPNPCVGGSAPLHPLRGGLAAPPLTPPHARRRRSDTTTHAKNITHTQQMCLVLEYAIYDMFLYATCF